jgi:large conductance mechanosensitive channel
MSSSIDQYDVDFNFVHFIKFLKDHNIITTAIAAILSDRINEITSTFVDYMIMPIINRDADKDGTKDIKNIEDANFNLFSVNFQYGKVLIAFVKFLIITYILFIITKATKNVIDF